MCVGDTFVSINGEQPRDVIRFSQGKLVPGGTANFVLAVTHTAAKARFYLVQHVRQPAVSVPPPTKFAATTPSMPE